jgi:hypothetical protein
VSETSRALAERTRAADDAARAAAEAQRALADRERTANDAAGESARALAFLERENIALMVELRSLRSHVAAAPGLSVAPTLGASGARLSLAPRAGAGDAGPRLSLAPRAGGGARMSLAPSRAAAAPAPPPPLPPAPAQPPPVSAQRMSLAPARAVPRSALPARAVLAPIANAAPRAPDGDAPMCGGADTSSVDLLRFADVGLAAPTPDAATADDAKCAQQ